MPENSGHFDDPELKAALRRAVGSETAPAPLRQRCESLFATSAAPTSARVDSRIERPSRWRIVRPALAIAAVFIIAVGVAMLAGLLPSPFASHTEQHMTAFTPTIAAAMVVTHDRCCKKADHHHIPGDDFVQLAKTMESQLNRKVIALPLATGDWKFNGAGVCSVGDTKSGHLVFSHGSQHVSIFSLPAKFEYCSDNYSYDYEKMVEHHPIAGFVRAGGLFCIVGSDPNDSITLQDVAKMRDDLKAKSSTAACHGILNTVAQMSIDADDLP